jgi:hypothetical protein
LAARRSGATPLTLAGRCDFSKERNMQTVRISPVEVQVGVVVYLFSNADIADGFYALASQSVDASRIKCKFVALCSRPVDCDHELGSWHD